MMRRVPCILTIVFALVLLPALATAESKDIALARNVNRIERFIYDKTSTGPLSDRLGRVERDLLGRESQQAVLDKVEHLSKFLFAGSNGVPSLSMKVGYIEWKIFKATQRGSLDKRLGELEKLAVGGRPSTEPLAFRVEQLVQLTVEDGVINLRKVRLAKGSHIKLRLEQTVNTKSAQPGEPLVFSIADNTFVDGTVLVVAQGAFAAGTVSSVRRGARFGRSGQINIQVYGVDALDGTALPVEIRSMTGKTLSKQHLGMAVGASTVGYLALGPLGLAGGWFVKGRDVEIPQDTEFVGATVADFDLYGMVIDRKGAK